MSDGISGIDWAEEVLSAATEPFHDLRPPEGAYIPATLQFGDEYDGRGWFHVDDEADIYHADKLIGNSSIFRTAMQRAFWFELYCAWTLPRPPGSFLITDDGKEMVVDFILPPRTPRAYEHEFRLIMSPSGLWVGPGDEGNVGGLFSHGGVFGGRRGDSVSADVFFAYLQLWAAASRQ